MHASRWLPFFYRMPALSESLNEVHARAAFGRVSGFLPRKVFERLEVEEIQLTTSIRLDEQKTGVLHFPRSFTRT
jgi:hypothetical protein